MVYAQIVSVESDGVTDAVSIEMAEGRNIVVDISSSSATAESVNAAVKQAVATAAAVSVNQVILLGAAS